MSEELKNIENEGGVSMPNTWDSTADVPFNKEQTDQNSSEKETSVVSVAQQHRQIWDKIVDRYQENKKRRHDIDKKLQGLGLEFGDFWENKDKLSDSLCSEYDKYREERNITDSLEYNFDYINDRMSERLTDYVLNNVDDDKIAELFSLDPRYKNQSYHNYEESIATFDDLLNDSEKFGRLCIMNAEKPIGEVFKDKSPKEIIQILEDSKKTYEARKEGQMYTIFSILQRVSYNKEPNNKITNWLDKNVPDHEKIEGEALLKIIDKEYDVESEEEIFSELFE